MTKSELNGDIIKYFANLEDQSYSRDIQMEALRATAKEIQQELAGQAIFKGTAKRWISGQGYRIYKRQVAQARVDDVEMSVTVSILGGKGGFVNRWLNRGTAGTASGRGANSGFTAKASPQFTEDIDDFNRRFKKHLTRIFEERL